MKDFKENGGNANQLSEVEQRRPKKCLSAYMIFVRETRSKVQKENQDMHVLEIMKQVGKQWQNLTDEERKVYQDKADEDKIRYRNELKAFESEVDKLGLKKSIKTQSRPKKKKAPSGTSTPKRKQKAVAQQNYVVRTPAFDEYMKEKSHAPSLELIDES